MSDGDSRVVLLTGCASGIGRRLARRCVERGDRVVATDIDRGGLDELARKADFDAESAVVRQLDVRDPDRWTELVEETVERFGRLDIAMNVAGYLKPGYAHQFEPEDVDLHLDVNAKGVIHGTRACAAVMVEQGAGHIVNIGSLASMAPISGLTLYTASKFAMRGFTLAAAQDLRPHGVDVSLVMPDAVRTRMLDLQVDYEEAATTFSGKRPLTLEEVEELVFDRVLPDRPLEITLPRLRGGLARLSNLAPQSLLALGPLIRKMGARNQSDFDSEE